MRCSGVKTSCSFGVGWTHDELRPETPVEAEEALVPEDFLHTVEAVLVQQLSNNSAPLILHSSHALSYDADARSEYVPHRVYIAHAHMVRQISASLRRTASIIP